MIDRKLTSPFRFRFGCLIFLFYSELTNSVVVIASNNLKSGFAFSFRLWRKLYLPIVLGLYPTTTGGSLWGVVGLSMGGGRARQMLSLTSRL